MDKELAIKINSLKLYKDLYSKSKGIGVDWWIKQTPLEVLKALDKRSIYIYLEEDTLGRYFLKYSNTCRESRHYIVEWTEHYHLSTRRGSPWVDFTKPANTKKQSIQVI